MPATQRICIFRLDTGCWPTLYRKCQSHNTPGKRHNNTWVEPSRGTVLPGKEKKLWCGNCNRHVCNKWKRVVDRPSRSKEVNTGKKERVALCRLLLISKFNGIHLTQVLFKHWVLYEQNIIDIPVCEIEPRCRLTIRWDEDQDLSPLRRFRQGPSYSPNRLVSQSAKL